MQAGEFFGEMALLNHEPRAATVRATSNVTTLSLDRDMFKALLGEKYAADLKSAAKKRTQKLNMLKRGESQIGGFESSAPSGIPDLMLDSEVANHEWAEPFASMKLNDCKNTKVLGMGTYGRVTLCHSKR